MNKYPEDSSEKRGISSKDYSSEVDRLNYNLSQSPIVRRSGLDDFLSGVWIENPRLKHCFSSVQFGMKMGGTVGGIFGCLAGSFYAIRERRPLLLPASVMISGVSFAFFLGCGMLVRC